MPWSRNFVSELTGYRIKQWKTNRKWFNGNENQPSDNTIKQIRQVSD